MTNTLNWNDSKKKIAIMVSKYDHCLWELLLRHRSQELDCEISAIISNHEDLRPVADTFNIPYHVFKITKATKAEVEKEELKLLKDELNVDLVILARYMVSACIHTHGFQLIEDFLACYALFEHAF